MGTLRLIEAARSCRRRAVHLHLDLCGARPDPARSAARRDPPALASKATTGPTRRRSRRSSTASDTARACRSAPAAHGHLWSGSPAAISKWYSLVERSWRGQAGRLPPRRKGGPCRRRRPSRRAPARRRPAAITGEAFNCCDRYVSEHEVATIARELSGSKSGDPRRADDAPEPDRDAEARGLGMTFGGTAASGARRSSS